MKYIVLLLFFPFYLQASIKVAFIELRNYKGEIIQLEPNGQFAHMAVSYRGQWLHAHPLNGVEIISQADLEKIGSIKTIITLLEYDELDIKQVEKYLGKPYDFEYSWGEERIYCAELVAKLLNIDPLPMNFESSFWSSNYSSLRGKLGLSPDDLYQHFKRKLGHVAQCSKIF